MPCEFLIIHCAKFDRWLFKVFKESFLLIPSLIGISEQIFAIASTTNT